MNKLFVFILIIILCNTNNVAQVYNMPTFERTDVPILHIDKVEITNTNTIIHCTYFADEGIGAYISRDMYIENNQTKKKYQIINSEGLPLSPNTKYFDKEVDCAVSLYFPPIKSLHNFNIIETSGNTPYNVYGINLDEKPYDKAYNTYDLLRFVRQREYYMDAGNIEKAIIYCKETLKAWKYLFGTKSREVGKSLYILASLYSQIGNYREAIRNGNEGLKIDLTSDNANIEDIINDYGNLSYYYNDIGDYKEAIKLTSESLAILEKKGVENEMYADVLNDLANFNNNLGNYNEAFHYANQAVKIKERIIGEHSESYAKSLSNLATAVSNLGNYDEAIEINKRALNIMIKEKGKYDISNAILIGNIAYNYAKSNNLSEAINYGEKACQLYSINNIENNDYVGFLNNVSMYYMELASAYKKNSDDNTSSTMMSKSLQYLDSAKIVADKMGDKNNLSLILNNQAYILNLQGNLCNAIDIQKEACNFANVATLDYSQYMMNLAHYHLENKEYGSALNIGLKAFDIFEEKIKNNLCALSSFDIANYWTSINTMYNIGLPIIAYYTKDEKAINYLYDKTALFAKGFLLNANSNIRDVLSTETNPLIIKAFNNLENNISLLDSLFNEYVVDSIKIESTKKEIKKEEDYISQNSLAYQSYLKNMDYHWQTVQKELRKSDIAIEFVKSPMSLFNDSVMYMALVLKSDYEIPKLVPLFNESELSDEINTLSTNNLYNLIWKPLENELQNVTSIYFSPVGLLYNIGIEYLPIDDEQNMSQKYDIIRLSSTWELVNSKNESNISKAALFGGISYDVANPNGLNNIVPDSIAPTDRSGKVILNRQGFEDLENTLSETYDIADVLKRGSVAPILFIFEKGSEDNFKKISGSKEVGIIHLATHGMYIAPSNASKFRFYNNFCFINNEDTKDISGESTALSRSFVVMAGGNKLPYRYEIPQNGNDGILTALEISRLDLRNVDLVVLSACQTALGDISNDGVLGLQRGFKKSGVNTILMSLDKVDDEAMKILMVEFYRNLMGGKTKLQSLKDAQKHLRQVDNGKYDYPKYWASFILLDGLN